MDFRFLFSQHPLCAMQLCHDLGVGVSLQRLQLWTKWLSVGFGILSFSTPFASLGLCPVDAFLCGSINVRNKCTGMGGCVRTQLVSWCAMVCFCCMYVLNPRASVSETRHHTRVINLLPCFARSSILLLPSQRWMAEERIRDLKTVAVYLIDCKLSTKIVAFQDLLQCFCGWLNVPSWCCLLERSPVVGSRCTLTVWL